VKEDVVGVDEVQALDQVETELPDGGLRQVMVLRQDVCQAAPSAQLYHQPQVVARLIPLVELHNVGVADVVCHTNLKKKSYFTVNFRLRKILEMQCDRLVFKVKLTIYQKKVSHGFSLQINFFYDLL
jgi:hypothetical protein